MNAKTPKNFKDSESLKIAFDYTTGNDPASDLKTTFNVVYRVPRYMAQQGAEDYVSIYNPIAHRVAIDKVKMQHQKLLGMLSPR